MLASAGIVVNSFDHRGHGNSKYVPCCCICACADDSHRGKRGHLLYAEAFQDIDLIAAKADPQLPHFLFGSSAHTHTHTHTHTPVHIRITYVHTHAPRTRLRRDFCKLAASLASLHDAAQDTLWELASDLRTYLII